MRVLQAVVLWLLCVAGLQAQITVVPTVKHLTSTSTPNAGTITLSVSGGTSPYSYTWTPGPVYTKDITNKAKNTYVVKVKDATAATVTYTYNLGYKADWDQMYGCFSRNDSLIGDASRTWSQAISKNNLAASTNGHVEYILKGMGETKVFGVLDSLSPMLDTYYDIDYGYYYDGVNNYLYEVIYGSLSNPVSGYTEGKALRIERSGSTIKFVVNGVTTHTLSDASAAAKVWKVKAMLYSDMAGNSFVNMGCSFATKGGVTFKNYSNLVPFVTHSSGSGSTNGSIRIKPLKTGTYTYTWQPGSVVSATLSSKAVGQYSLSAKDATNTITPKNYNIGYKVNWDQPYACSIKHDTLITDESYSWGSAISKNTLPGGTDGWFEYILRDMNQYRIVGFTSGLSLNPQDIYDIDYGFYYESGTLYSFGESGYFVPMIYQVLEGTVLRVERRGDTVEYKINGNRYSYAVDAASAAKDWKVKGTVYGAYGSSLVNVGCSFYGQGNSNFPNYNRLVPYISHASNAGTADGSVSVSPAQSGSYTYTWQPGAVTGNTTGSQAAGNYSVTVKDALNNQNTLAYNIGYKVQWDRFNGSERRGDTLIYKSPEGITWGTAVSKNTLPGGTDGWVEWVFRDPTQTVEFGFLDSLSAYEQDIYDFDYGLYYQTTNNTIYGLVNHQFVGGIYYAPSVGSVIRIERIDDTIRFLVNSMVVASYVDSAAAQRTWKIKGVVFAGGTSSLINVGCSFDNQGYAYFPNYTRLMPEIVHSSAPGANDGSIRVTPRQAGTYSYAWEPGGETSNVLSSKTIGNYSLMVQDALHHLNLLPYQIGYKVYWDSLYGAETNGDTLVITTPMYQWGQGLSKNTLSGGTDGWVEYILQDMDDDKFFGFLDQVSAYSEDYTDLDYAFYCMGSNRTLYTIAEGNWTAVRYHLPVGSRLRIDRIGDTIVFTVDGIVVNSLVNAVETAKTWKVKALVNLIGTSRFVNVGCSFGYDNSLNVTPFITNYRGEASKGQINLNISGGIPPYQVAWNNTKLPSSTVIYHAMLLAGYPESADSLTVKHSIDSLKQVQVYSGLMPGKYTVTVYDANNDSVPVVCLVGTDMDTLIVSRVSISHPATRQIKRDGVLYSSGEGVSVESLGGIVTGENLAIFSHVISPLKESRVEFEVGDTSLFTFGLTPLVSTIPYGNDDVKAKVGFIFSGDTYKIFLGNLQRFSGTYQAGDVFALANTSSGLLKFYKNDVEVYTGEFASVAAPTDEFIYKAVLGSSNAKLINIKVLTPKTTVLGVTGNIKDVTCSNPCSGSLDVLGIGKLISIPNKYELYADANPTVLLSALTSFGPGNRALFPDLCAGKYTIKFYYTRQNLVFTGGTPSTSIGILQGNFEVAYSPDWTNTINTVVLPDRSLMKSSGGSFAWDAGASTNNFLASSDNGWVEWSAPSVNSMNAVGLNDYDNSTDITDIDYAYGYFKYPIIGLWKYWIKTRNATMMSSFFSGSMLHPFNDNDKFRLEKNGTTINLLLNGVQVDQYAAISLPSGGFVVDASLKALAGTINQPRLSFGCRDVITQCAVPKSLLDGGYYLLDGVNLRFTLDGEYTLSKMKFRVMNTSRSVVLSDNSSSGLLSVVTTKPGDNRYTLDCSGLASGYYTLEIMNEKKETLYLRFKR